MQLLALALQAAGPQAVRRLLLSSSSFDGLAQVALRLLSLHIRRLAMRNATNTVPSSNGHGHMVNNIASGNVLLSLACSRRDLFATVRANMRSWKS